MHTSQLLLRLGASLLCAAGIANANYAITDTFDNTNFFDEWNFFSGADPTNGFVKYASSALANTSSLAGYSGNSIYLGVDSTTVNPTGGRASVRVSSQKSYTHGLFIADIAHMPSSTCGLWPAWWTFGPNWPASGEIDIIEGVNSATTDTITLHTAAGCSMSSTGSLAGSTLLSADCEGNNGCSMTTTNSQGYGSGFNANGGGVYAMQWESTGIYVWFFPRSAIPADITSGSPNPSGWGTPTATFASSSSCEVDQFFMNHNIVFDTTFCGDWAGQASVWDSSCQASTGASTCEAYVAANPSAFTDAYWLINSVKVYSLGATKRDAVVPRPFMA
ncbi:glycoside hydrolase family 16 protein [Hyaloscypha variabilis]